MSVFNGDQIKAKLAASVLMTIPGTPFVYYGEEIGMTGNKPDEKIRTPMLWSTDKYAGFSTVLPWEPTNSNYEQFNVVTENTDPNSLLSLYRNIIQLRNNHAALRVGDFYTVRSDNFSILAYLRSSKEENLLVIINLSEQPVSGFSLSLNQGPLAGIYNVAPILGVGPFADLIANANGGFDAYQPGPEIPANGMFIYQLQGK
jgi:glycosidase